MGERGRGQGAGDVRREIAHVQLPRLGDDDGIRESIAGAGDKGALEVERLDEVALDELGEGRAGDLFGRVGQDLEGHVGVAGGVVRDGEGIALHEELEGFCGRSVVVGGIGGRGRGCTFASARPETDGAAPDDFRVLELADAGDGAAEVDGREVVHGVCGG